MAQYLNKDAYTYQMEKDRFIQELKHFHRTRGTLFRRIPVIRGKPVDLYLLYTKVIALGGWEKVNDEQRWEEVSEFCNIPKICTNAAQALKLVYIRYLHLYERVYHFGEDPNQKDSEDRENTPAHKRKNAPIAAVPLMYNYSQHEVSASLRRNLGLCTKFLEPGEFDKMEKALLSGLPNEVDFVVNVCTLLSNEGKHVMLVEKAPRLLNLLMAQVGIFSNNAGSYEDLYNNSWRVLSDRNFFRFWYDSVEESEVRNLISPKLKDKPPDKEPVGKEVLHLGQDLGIRDMEGQRIHQLGAIVRNLSFEEGNQLPLANSYTIYRFLILCANSCHSSLRQLALDTLGNLSSQMVLDPKSSELMLKLISKSILSVDKFHIVRGMEILSKLAQTDENEEILTENLSEELYERIVTMLSVQDIQMIVYTLEVLYQLSEMGEVPSTHIAQIRSAIDVLVNLVTVEAQSYGPNSLIGIKVVEHTPVSSLTASGQVSMAAGAVATPSQQPSKQTVARAVTATPPPAQKNPKQLATELDSDTFACNWLQAHYESHSESSTLQIDMFADYISYCKKQMIPNVLNVTAFINSIRVVFPKIDIQRHEIADGGSEIKYVGLRKRVIPLPLPQQDRGTATPTNKMHRAPTPNMATPSPPSKRRKGNTPPRPGTPNQSRKGNSVIHQHLQTPIQSMPRPNPLPSQQQGQQQMPSPTYPNIQQALLGSSPDSSPNPQSQSPQQLPSPSQLTSFAMRHNRGGSDTNLIKTLLKVKVNQSMSKAAKQAAQVPPPSSSASTLSASCSTTPKQDAASQPLQLKFFNQSNPQVRQVETSGDVQGSASLADSVSSPQGYAEFAQQQMYAQMAKAQQFIESTEKQVSNEKSPAKEKKSRRNSTGSCNIQSPRSPRPGSPRCKSPRSTSPRAVARSPSPHASSPQSPRSRQLEVCAQVERAQDVVTATERAHEARIEKVYNKCATKVQVVEAEMDKIENCRNMSGAVEAKIERVLNAGVRDAVPEKQHERGENCPDLAGVAPCSNASNKLNCKNTAPLGDGALHQQSDTQQPYHPITPGLPDNRVSTSSKSDLYDHVNIKNPDTSSHSVNMTDTMSHQVNVSHMSSNKTDRTSFTHENGQLEKSSDVSENGRMCSENLSDKTVSHSLTNGSATSPVLDGSKSGGADVSGLLPPLSPDHSKAAQDVALINGISEDLLLDGKTSIADVIESKIDQMIVNGVTKHLGSGDYLNKSVRHVEAAIHSLKSCEEQRTSITQDLIKAQAKCSDIIQVADKTSITGRGDTQPHVPEKPVLQNGCASPVRDSTLPLDQTSKTDASNCGDKSSVTETPLSEHCKDKVPESAKHGSYNKSFCMYCKAEINPADSKPQCPHHSASMDATTTAHLPETDYSNVNGSLPLSNHSDSMYPSSDISRTCSVTNVMNSCVTANYKGTSDCSAVNHTPLSLPLPTSSSSYSSSSDSLPLSSPSLTGGETVTNSLMCDTVISQQDGVSDTVQQPVSQSEPVSSSQSGSLSLSTAVTVTTVQRSCDTNISPASQTRITPHDVASQSSLTQHDNAGPTSVPQHDRNEIRSNPLSLDVRPNISHQQTVVIVSQNPVIVTGPATTAAVVSKPTHTDHSSVVTTGQSAVHSQQPTTSIPLTVTIPQEKLASPPSSGPQVIVPSPKLPTPQPSPQSGHPVTSVIREQLLAGTKRPLVTETVEKSAKKKKSKSRSSSIDSRRSSTQSSVGSTENMCEWIGCKLCFDSPAQVHGHATIKHVVKGGGHQVCRWEGCDGLPRATWSLVQHILDRHCTEAALKAAALRRHQISQMGTPPPPPPETPVVPPPVYPSDAAVQAIRRFTSAPPFQEFVEMKEGPVTKHIRLTSSLILRNLARYSHVGRSLIKRHEHHLAYVALSNVESSTAISNCLWEILQKHCH